MLPNCRPEVEILVSVGGRCNATLDPQLPGSINCRPARLKR